MAIYQKILKGKVKFPKNFDKWELFHENRWGTFEQQER
jgi:hypothetical protein